MKIKGEVKVGPDIVKTVELDNIRIYCDCGAELKDGNFAMIDGVPMCLECREKFNDSLLEDASKKLIELYG